VGNSGKEASYFFDWEAIEVPNQKPTRQPKGRLRTRIVNREWTGMHANRFYVKERELRLIAVLLQISYRKLVQVDATWCQ
jgi:hypothetical protein